MKTIPKNQSPLFETRLIWMRDNQPELLMELWKEKKLMEKVLKDLEAADRAYSAMRSKGVSQEQAEEVMLHILAPADNMDIDREVMEIPDETFQQILEETTY